MIHTIVIVLSLTTLAVALLALVANTPAAWLAVTGCSAVLGVLDVVEHRWFGVAGASLITVFAWRGYQDAIRARRAVDEAFRRAAEQWLHDLGGGDQP